MFAARSQSRSKAFTLIELLVVISIIGVLIALLLPAVQRVREAANQTRCKNNLKQISLAMTNYYTSHQSFPPASQTKLVNNQPVQHGWLTFILPQLELDTLYARYDFDKMWISSVPNDPEGNTNQKVVQQPVNMVVCPSAPSQRTDPTTTAAVGDYSPITEVDARVYTQVLGITLPKDTRGVLVPNIPTANTKVRISDINDGASNTLMIVEVAGRPELWSNKGLVDTKSAPSGGWGDPANGMILHGYNPATQTSPGSCAVNCTNISNLTTKPQIVDGEIYAFHPGVAIFAFADGSVRSLNAQLPMATFAALATRRGNDLVQGLD